MDPHYWPFRGLVWSFVVHASIFTGLISLAAFGPSERSRLRDRAVILDAGELDDVLYLPLLGSASTGGQKENESSKAGAASGKAGLSYPGPQPVLSDFPNATNQTQTLLQPALKNPPTLQLPLALPNVVRMATPDAPPVEAAKIKMPDPVTPPAPPMTGPVAQLDVPLTAPTRPLAAPVAQSRFRVPDVVAPPTRPLTAPVAQLNVPLSGPARPLAAPVAQPRFQLPDNVNPQTQPTLTAPVAQLDVPLSGPARPLAAPRAEPRFRLPDPVTPQNRAAAPVAQLDVSLSGPSRPLAAPVAESRFKLPDPVTPQTQAALTVPLARLDTPLPGPAKPLAAPVAESRFRLPDSAAPATRSTPTGPVAQLDVPLSGPARPLAAPVAESRFKLPDSAAPPTRSTPTGPVAQLDVPLSGPAKPLAAPIAESRFRLPDSGTPLPRSTQAGTVAQLDLPPAGPLRPLAAPLAESKIKMPDSTSTVGPVAPPQSIARLDVPLTSNGTAPRPPAPPTDTTQSLLALSPTPARRDQPAVVPAGEARGRFAISPDPNLSFPGTEPGSRGAATTSAAGGPNISTAKNDGPSISINTGGANAGAGANAFPGITILSAAETAAAGRNSTPTNSQPDADAQPLQTSYNMTLLAPGSSGGGLPDFGVFTSELVHTVYLDMRRTIREKPLSWTVEFGIPQREGTPENERQTRLDTLQDTVLPFPIFKERPALPEAVVRRNTGRMVIVYAVITAEGKVEQLSIKDSPDSLLNEPVLSAMRKWTFRPARRDGQVVPAKMLLGIPVSN